MLLKCRNPWFMTCEPTQPRWFLELRWVTPMLKCQGNRATTSLNLHCRLCMRNHSVLPSNKFYLKITSDSANAVFFHSYLSETLEASCRNELSGSLTKSLFRGWCVGY